MLRFQVIATCPISMGKIMDITSTQNLATQITLILAPFTPLLVSAGKEASKEIGKGIGQETIKIAKKLWSTIKDASPDNEKKLLKTAEDIAEFPDDEDYKVKLTKELLIALEKQPELAQALSAIIQHHDEAVQQVLIENESQAKNINLRIANALGKQKVTVNKSTVGDITIEQG